MEKEKKVAVKPDQVQYLNISKRYNGRLDRWEELNCYMSAELATLLIDAATDSKIFAAMKNAVDHEMERQKKIFANANPLPISNGNRDKIYTKRK